MSPLYQAAQDGHLDLVKVLVENYEGLDINHTTMVKMGVVVIASYTYLVSQYYSTWKLDWSALAVTVKNGHEDVAHYLVEKGADVTHKKKVREYNYRHRRPCGVHYLK